MTGWTHMVQMGGLIHILLVVALIVVVFNLISGRRAL